eukprot:TRINITY_DN3398_c0_g1_i1.p1 TRINITY_DN3398_c0_g1~~TRINITY_DN3398_c0_g1_i1.p1  ORF type:complete len:834 (-),score=39.12 TRINITY_DN3398_c0_g1_i1:56-2557(-)
MTSSIGQELRKRPGFRGDTTSSKARQLESPVWEEKTTHSHPLYEVMAGLARTLGGPKPASDALNTLETTRTQCVACARKLVDPCKRHRVPLYHKDYHHWRIKGKGGRKARKGSTLAIRQPQPIVGGKSRFLSPNPSSLPEAPEWDSDTSSSVEDDSGGQGSGAHTSGSTSTHESSPQSKRGSSSKRRRSRHRFVFCLSLVSLLFLVTFAGALVGITVSTVDWKEEAPVSTLSVAAEIHRHLWNLDEMMLHPLISVYEGGNWTDMTTRFDFTRDYLSYTLGMSTAISKKGLQMWIGSSSGTFVSMVMTGTDFLERYTMSPTQVGRQQLVREVITLDKWRGGNLVIRSTEELRQEAFVVQNQGWFANDRATVPRNHSKQRPWDVVDIAERLPWYDRRVAYNCITLQHATGGMEKLRLCAGLPLDYVHEVITAFVRTGVVQHAFFVVESGQLISPQQSGQTNDSTMIVNSVAEFNARHQIASGLSEVIQRISEVSYREETMRCLYDPEVPEGQERERTLLTTRTGRGSAANSPEFIFVGTCLLWHNNHLGVIQFSPIHASGSDSLSFGAVSIAIGIIFLVALSSKIGGTIVLLLEDYEHRLQRLDSDFHAVLDPIRKETFSEFTQAIEPYAEIRAAVERINEFIDRGMVQALRQTGQFGILGLRRCKVSVVSVFAETDLMLSSWPECRRYVESLNGIFDSAAEMSHEAFIHFNALTECPTHCVNALSFAMELRRHLRDCKKAYIYLSTGLCFVGNVGTSQEMQFSILGPATSSISHVQKRARRSQYDGPLTLLVSQDVVYALDDHSQGQYSWRQWDEDDDIFTLAPDTPAAPALVS